MNGVESVSRFVIAHPKGARKSKEMKKGYPKAEPLKSEKGTSFFDLLHESLKKFNQCAICKIDSKFACISVVEENDPGLVMNIFEEVDWIKGDFATLVAGSISEEFSQSLQQKSLFKEDPTRVSLIYSDEILKFDIQRLSIALRTADIGEILKIAEKIRINGQIYHLENINKILIQLIRLQIPQGDNRMDDVIEKLENNVSLIQKQ